MKRFAILATLLLAACALVVAGTAAAKPKKKVGPFESFSPDSGTCGNDWANDTFDRVFKVKDNKDGTFRVKEEFKHGEFTTLAGASPGACETGTEHGTLVGGGKTGKFEGFLEGTVTGSTGYDPSGCNTNPTPCDTTAGFILTAFGPTATYSCVTGIGDCSFEFKYEAHGQGLIYRHWVNASADRGGNRGDIADA